MPIRLIRIFMVTVTLLSIVGITMVESNNDPALITEDVPDGQCFMSPEYDMMCGHVPPVNLNDGIEAAAAEYDIDPWLIAVTVYRESGCDQYAFGSVGEIGLAQVHPSVWMRTLRRVGIARRPQELYDMRTNLRAAAYILRRAQEEAEDDLFGTFRRYNGRGPKARQYAREQVEVYTSVTGL
jgi:hypothetical protein